MGTGPATVAVKKQDSTSAMLLLWLPTLSFSAVCTCSLPARMMGDSPRAVRQFPHEVSF